MPTTVVTYTEVTAFSPTTGSRLSQIAKASHLLENFSETTCETIFKNVVARLRRDTYYFTELEDSGIARALEEGLSKAKLGALVIYLPETNPCARFLKAKIKSSGIYIPPFDSAVIFAKRPSSKEMLQSLLDHGTLPETIAVLDRELTHDAHVSNIQRICLWAPLVIRSLAALLITRIFGLAPGIGFNLFSTPSVFPFKNSIFGTNIPQEIYGIESIANSPILHSSDSNGGWSTNSLIDSLNLKGEKLHMVKEALFLIHSLRLLDVDPKVLCQMVMRSTYDRETRTYPILAALLHSERERLGLRDEAEFLRMIHEMEITRNHDIADHQEIAAQYSIEEILGFQPVSPPSTP